MSYKINCPHCNKALNVTEPAFGKTVPCPGCNQLLKVPQPAAMSSAPADEDAAAASGVPGSRSPRVLPVQLPAGMPPMPDADMPVEPPDDRDPLELPDWQPRTASSSPEAQGAHWPRDSAAGSGRSSPDGATEFSSAQPRVQSPLLENTQVADAIRFFDFNFDRLVTLTILKFVWKLWLILALLALIVVASGALWNLPVLKAFSVVLGQLIVLSVITLGVRIYLELICVVFRMAEDLRAVRDKHSTPTSGRSH